jgi:hypothetical protein
MNACQFLARWSKATGPLGLLSQQLLDSTIREMTPNERAAGRLFSAEPHWALPLPGLIPYAPLLDDLVSLTEFIPLTAGQDATPLSAALHDVQVARENINGITVPYVQVRAGLVVPELTPRDTPLETLQQALLESIQTNAETGTQWHIAMTATYLLKLLQNQTPPIPAITGLI